MVLDTNVLVSLYVFGDACLLPLSRALEAGSWQALSRAELVAEFERVLTYPAFALSEARQAELAARWRVLALNCDGLPPASAALPRCRDRADQKFLELARDAAADALISADKDLLVLRRRRKWQAGFALWTPDEALARLTSA